MTAAIPVGDAALAARLVDRMDLVETRLRAATANHDALADTASRHLMAAGGKRLRPFLTLLTAELGDGGADDAVVAGTVVELTHLASLYHDDVMDSAAVRRGVPAAHAVWGNTVAILMGDLLFARASALVSGLGPDAVLLQSETFERLCMGQLHETVGPQDGDDAVDHYLQVLADKTGSLIALSARFGALLSGCAPEVVTAVTGYGEKVGVSFQLADDVIDLTSSGSTSGKTPGTDLREHVPTMPVLLLRRLVASGEAGPADVDLLALLDSDLSDDAVLAGAVAALREHRVVAQTRDLAVRWAHDAVAELAPLPAGHVKDALSTFADALSDRAS
ncbi:heptaprenyl diphosphate synthase [Luteimicrobium subarcticum]|uniref:Heptaprenyl diphosphate synthase n=2 Tax=Luteimicrobium subarcticum TaxID=620910 RepID=A0A2M8WVN7_9MICO|nr:heptaprenyl diphosphate synthase [Luteimicrobium subarcticum]